jgi:hypothetical protein
MAYNMEVPVATMLRGIAGPEVAYLIASFVPTGFVVDLLAPRLESEAMDVNHARVMLEKYYTRWPLPLWNDARHRSELFADVIKRIGWSTPDAQLQLQRFFLPMPMSMPLTMEMTEDSLVHNCMVKLFAGVLDHLTAVYADLVGDPTEGMSPSWHRACDDDLRRLVCTMKNILGVARGMIAQ